MTKLSPKGVPAGIGPAKREERQATAQRRREDPPDEVRARKIAAALDAAWGILDGEGLYALSTNKVSERAGVSVGFVHKQIGDRDAVIRALIGRERRWLLTAIQPIGEMETGREALLRVIEALVDQQFKSPVVASQVGYEERRLRLGEEESVGGAIRVFLNSVLPRLNMGRSIDPERDLDNVVAIVRGMAHAAACRGEPDRRRLRSAIADALAGYLHMNS